jgi:hypothetical protein
MMPTLSIKGLAYTGIAGAVVAMAIMVWTYREDAQKAEAKANQASAETSVWRATAANWQAASNTNRASYDLAHNALKQQTEAVALIRTMADARAAVGDKVFREALRGVARREALLDTIMPTSPGIAACRTSAATMALRGEL